MPNEIRAEDIEPGQPVEVDLLKPEDAPGVAALFRAVYGESYPVRIYLDPASLVQANQKGAIISSVARTAGGDIVGHGALFQWAPYAKTYEAGGGLVLPSYRQGNISTRMCKHVSEVGAPRFGVEMVFGEPICNHTFSQEMFHALGWTSMAAEIDLMPAVAYVKEKSAPGRVSALLDFSATKPASITVQVPARYESQLGWLYEVYPEPRELVVSREPLPAGQATRLHEQYHDFAQVARLAIPTAGADLGRRMQEVEARLWARGAQMIEVFLNAGQPWVGAAADALHDLGFFLGGALPRWFDQDGLLLQKLASAPDWDQIKLAFDRGRELVDLVRADWQSTQ